MPQCPTGSPMSAIAGGNGVPRAVATDDPKIIFVANGRRAFQEGAQFHSQLWGFSPLPHETSLGVIDIDHPSGREFRRVREHKSCSMLRRLLLINPAVLDSPSQEIKHIIHIRPLARSSRAF
jgi:hypothetical protein